MEKWDYLYCSLDVGNGSINKVRYIDNVMVEDWFNSESFIEKFKQLGNEGWELVAFTYVNTFKAVFKKKVV